VSSRIFRSFFFANALRWWLAAGTVFLHPAGAVADSVTEWNETALACTLTAKQPSYVAARTMAMVHVAMFDALNSIEHGYTPYVVEVSSSAGASGEAASVAAAHAVLLKIFPEQSAVLDAAYTASLARIPDGNLKVAGIAIGEKAATQIISLRAADGADLPNHYRPITAPGVYVVTTLPVGANWGHVKPWIMERGSQFRPVPPPPVDQPGVGPGL
jgi:hypothetical protein